MIQKTNIFLLGVILFVQSCDSGRSELALPKAKPEPKRMPTFSGYNSIIQMKEDHITQRVTKHSLLVTSGNDTTTLTHVHLPCPGTNGDFYMLNAKRGEQYTIPMLNKGSIDVSAATTMFTDLSISNRTCIIRGRACFITDRFPMTVYADEFKIQIPPYSSVNVENYLDDPTIIISAIKGNCRVDRFGEIIMIGEHQEVWADRDKSNSKIKNMQADASSWINGKYIHDDVDLSYAVRELGRLYDKNVITSGIDSSIQHLTIPYRNATLDDMLQVYSDAYAYLKFEVNGNNLFVQKNRNYRNIPLKCKK